ncbi:MAG: hypothetical protein P8O23_06030 [Opitutales bacterium]|nr:hypothetical protein [Opitutales bacterium]
MAYAILCDYKSTYQSCHCEEGTQARDAASHRVSRDADGVVSSLPCTQCIATGFRPRDDKVFINEGYTTHSRSQGG